MNDRPVMEAAREGDAEDALMGLVMYFNEEAVRVERALEDADMDEEPDVWNYRKGRLDQARLMHSVAAQAALVLLAANAKEAADAGGDGE